MLFTSLLSKLPKVVGVTPYFKNDVEITGICPDSSRVEQGSLYIAIEGLRADGHDFIEAALEHGASALAVSKKAFDEGRIPQEAYRLPLLVSDDTRGLSAHLFSAWYDHPERELRMVGVTGTNGKTTVSSLISEILNYANIPCGLIGTLGCFSQRGRLNVINKDPNANMTTPDPEALYKVLRLMVDEGAEAVVMEVSSHALALRKLDPVTFDVAVFTNLTEDHLDFHKNMENYFAEKSKLFECSRLAVINYDDRYGRRLADNINIEKRLCSAEGRETDSYGEDVRLRGSAGIEYKLVSRDTRLRVRSPLCGGFNVMNTLEAAVAARAMGAPLSAIKDALGHFEGVKGRLERVRLEGKIDFSVYIDYAHTPDALENLLRTARGFAKEDSRVVLLFGCGGERDRQKRPLMGKIAVSMADFVIITGDNSRSECTMDIIKDIISGIDGSDGAPYTVIESRRDAIEYAVRNAVRGDLILLAGKGHEEYEIGNEGKRPFSERETVKEFVEKYYG